MISPAAPRKQTARTSESPASPSSSRASKQDDSDDSAGELSSALCLSDSNRGEQLATPNASKQAGGKRKRAPSTRYTSNKGLPSWKSDQPTGVLRAPANPMVQPQRAAPPAEPALQIIHGDNDCMQGQGLRGADNCARSCPSRASRSRWSLDREGSSDHTAVPLGWVESGLGRKSRLCEVEGNLGQRRRTRVLPPKLEGPERRYKWSLWLDVEHPRTTNKIAVELAWHERQLSVCR